MIAARGGKPHPSLFDALAEDPEMGPVLAEQHEAMRQEEIARAKVAEQRARSAYP